MGVVGIITERQAALFPYLISSLAAVIKTLIFLKSPVVLVFPLTFNHAVLSIWFIPRFASSFEIPAKEKLQPCGFTACDMKNPICQYELIYRAAITPVFRAAFNKAPSPLHQMLIGLVLRDCAVSFKRDVSVCQARRDDPDTHICARKNRQSE